MDLKGKTPGILGIAVLLVGLSACATAGQTPPPPAPPPPPPTTASDCGSIGNHVIDVGTTVECKWAPLHSNAKGNGSVINWTTRVDGMGIKIQFDNSPFKSPLNCDGKLSACPSGPLRESITGDPPAAFTYHVWLCDKSLNCGNEIDPGIIIVP